MIKNILGEIKPIDHRPMLLIIITLGIGLSLIIGVGSLPLEEQNRIRDSSPGMNLTVPQIAELRGVSVNQIWGEFFLFTVLSFGVIGIFLSVNVPSLKRKMEK